jgi:two-component system osmolarity sensor histidine kinase EnvZ
MARTAADAPEAASSGLTPLEATPDRAVRSVHLGLNLFWRTFFLLALLLLGSMLVWLQTLRSLESEPRAIQTAQQIASLVNLSRAALIHADSIARVSLIKTMTEQEGLHIVPREVDDSFEPVDSDDLGERVAQELTERLGPATVVASKVNGTEGLWVGFEIDGDNYWLLTDRARFNRAAGRTLFIWLIAAGLLSMFGAALIARLINQPLRKLSVAASQVRDGNFQAVDLDEQVATNEIREVNIGFNRMTQKLAKLEQDRAVMLAGISHDLRTPLARLRLETELSVADVEARDHMAADIEQLDAIINKFMDYARPEQAKLVAVSLNAVIDACLYAVRDHTDLVVHLDLGGPHAPPLLVMADEVELKRVISNLLENARRYGRSVDSNVAMVEIAARIRDKWVLLKVRDRGQGVRPDQIDSLTEPFYRGDTARTSATGAGLGLSIVKKNIQHMGGQFALANSASGGLAAHIRLQRAEG